MTELEVADLVVPRLTLADASLQQDPVIRRSEVHHVVSMVSASVC